ncbi:MAG: hypothetical protein Q7P63_00565 [Verrucomicrobiota bacterium JB022]|nr:hypothetical protein [Verrucomicrobiota bacterium JB022]
MPEEYYIRQPDSETAKGPYNVDKLVTLAEAGQVTRETLYYDDELESWAAVGSNEELKQLIFPERRKLTLRKKGADELNLLSGEDEEDEAVTVRNILAAAEGKTEDTRHLSANVDWRKRVAGWSTNLMGLCLLASAAAIIMANLGFFQQVYAYYSQVAGIAEAGEEAVAIPGFSTAVVLAMLDVLFGLLTLAGMTSIYPLLRARSMFWAGYFALYFYGRMVLGDPHGLLLLLSVLAAGAGLFTMTLATHLRTFLPAAIAALLGTGFFAYVYIGRFVAELMAETEEKASLLTHWIGSLS